MDPASAEHKAGSSAREALVGAAVVIIAGILATSLSQPQVLARIPIQNLLKNQLHVDRTANAAFFFWIGLPWYFKPFAGIFTDAFPLFGSRRKSYILISATLASLSWVGLYFTPHTYSKLLWMVTIIDFFMVITSTVVGAYLVEVAQKHSGSGRLTALRQVVSYGSIMGAGPLGGYLASLAFGVTLAASGGVMFIIVPVTIFYLHEQRQKIDSKQMLANARQQLKHIGTARTMWAATGLLALFYIAPGYATALFYRQQNLLHMTTETQGTLQFLSGAGGVLAAIVYAWACKRLNLRSLLLICISLTTVTDLGYWYYNSLALARVIDTVYGIGFTLAECALMDLAVRATPKGNEGLGYSLMLSVRNLALFGTDALGSWLMDRYHVAFNSLITWNAITTAVTIPLVLLLPLALVIKKDAEPLHEVELPHTALQE
ncbi:MAG TPA: MFS transporter [Terriglobales bacterium]|nr:MFS transporter [Terriglobales bacterium]